MFIWLALRNSLVLFLRCDYSVRCSALTYTSLLSFIPLLSVLISLFSRLPFVKDHLPAMEQFVFHHFLPQQGEKLFEYIESFITQATQLPWTQFLFLIVVSGSLLLSVEKVINQVWNAERRRDEFLSLLRSLVVIAFTTVFLVVSLMLSAYILSAPLLHHFYLTALLHDYASWWLPFLISFVGFSFLYFVMPKQKVRLKNAFIGAGIVSLFFEFMKHGFAWYIEYVSNYNVIYGSLGAIPLFMIWIYSFWCLLVYGALVTNQLGKLN